MSTIVEKPVVTYYMRLMCDCGSEMKHDGFMLASHPPQYPHFCPDCGKQETHGRVYPYIGHREGP